MYILSVETPRMGRPPKAAKDRRGTRLPPIQVTERENKDLVAAAKRSGKEFAPWAREILLDAARALVQDGKSRDRK